MSTFTPDELAARLKAHPFAEQRERLMSRITYIAQAHAQTRTPVLTGNLRRSETTRVESGGLRGWIGTATNYAPFVHQRVPFFSLGIQDSRAEIDKLLQAAGDAWAAQIAN